jgi:hypothetical protein
MDSLVEAITELVIKELEAVRKGTGAPAPAVSSQAPRPKAARLLVVPGPEPVREEVWSALASARTRSSALVWNGFRQDQLPAAAAGWPLESRGTGWSKVVGDYQAVCLLGSDLPTLGSIGAGGLPPAGVAVAAVAAGLPVFCEAGLFERLRRHSARLAPGFMRAFEEAWRTVASFGVELGGPVELAAFLARRGAARGDGAAGPAAKSGGRDVVTGEDVEAARRAGQTVLSVGMGAIVTPLARQQAAEWGIEVKFQ